MGPVLNLRNITRSALLGFKGKTVRWCVIPRHMVQTDMIFVRHFIHLHLPPATETRDTPFLCVAMDSPLPREAPSLRLGGTYFPGAALEIAVGIPAPEATGAPAGASAAGVPSSFSFSCRGASVSLYGHRVVQWSPLQIRHCTIFWVFSLLSGSSSSVAWFCKYHK